MAAFWVFTEASDRKEEYPTDAQASLKRELNHDLSADNSAFSRRPPCRKARRSCLTGTGPLEFLSRHLRGG